MMGSNPSWDNAYMKNKNMRELEKQWAEKAKKAAKTVKPVPKKKGREQAGEATGRGAEHL